MSGQPDKLRSRLKQFLGLKRESRDLVSPQLPTIVVEEPAECDELLKEISPESGNSRSSRSRILRELCEVVAAKELEEYAVEALWLAVKDLLNEENAADIRQITLQFLTSLVTGQYKHLKLLRAHFFMVIENHNVSEDLLHRLYFLKALSLDGKDILYFEEQIGPFLLSMMPNVVFAEKMEIFLPLLRNFIRYNSSYFDDEIVSGLVKQTCHICTMTDQTSELEQCLTVLDAVVRYSSLPYSALYSFLVALCSTVNIKQFCEPSWRLMRHLLGTHLGHNGVLTMCCILEDSNNWNKCSLLRGAVFFVGMCLWGSKRVNSLMHKPIAVLPSMHRVLSCGHETVICEVTLSLQRLVKKYGGKQDDVAWESILEVTSTLLDLIQRDSLCCVAVAENFHVLLSCIEEMYEKKEFYGSADKLFDIVAKCTKNRPESSVILLVSHRAKSLQPYYDDWFQNIQDLLNNYFKNEERPSIRLKVLDELSVLLAKVSPLYEEEVLENAILHYLDNIAEDPHLLVRIRAVQLLIDVVERSESSKVSDVLNVIEKVTLSPVDPLKRQIDSSNKGSDNETSLQDIKEVTFGLVRLFKVKIFHKPSEHAKRIFNILVSHINAHYNHGYRTHTAAEIRLEILKCFLSLRADSCLRLGIIEANEIKFSSYFTCSEIFINDCMSRSIVILSAVASGSETSGLAVLPFSSAMKIILMCLQQELEWQVLDVVLKIIPQTLEDKNLILSSKQYLGSLCIVLSKMVSNYDFLPGLFQVPRDMRRPHLYTRIFPVLTELCTYHSYIDPDEQFSLMHAMEIGLVSYSAASCVSFLTICMLEMPSVMAKLLPTYLGKFAKLSPTSQIAIPLLEFLSALSNLKDLYTSFTSIQFKQIFGICLPFTDSTRYTQYTVMLAHKVISSWFISCPLLLRKQFVPFITKSLRVSAQSFSTPSTNPTAPTSSAQATISADVRCNELNSEMVETTIDMMVQYTFSSSLFQPKRTAVIEKLLANGTSRTWLLGNVLVTVTVSKRCSSNTSCAYCSTEEFPKEEITKQQNSATTIITTDQKSLSTEKNKKTSIRSSTEHFECICQDWAELLIRRPTGNRSWILRLQNRPNIHKPCSRVQIEKTMPEIYDSLIPQQFFDDLFTDMSDAKSNASTTIGLFSQSADSDTLVVDLVPDQGEICQVEDESENLLEKDWTQTDSDMMSTSRRQLNIVPPFVKRTRCLSRSPVNGPIASMLHDFVEDSENGQHCSNTPDRTSKEDLICQDDFEKPVLGKSPLDASPIKHFLHQDENVESENRKLDESVYTDIINEEDSPINASEKLNGNSRAKSPDDLSLTKMSHEISQDIRQSRNWIGYVSNRKTPSRNVPIKENKSATVDIGVLNRVSTSPDVNEPSREKRGILKLFENENQRKQAVLLRRQTYLSEVSKSKLNRRSYDGPFSDSVTSDHEQYCEDFPQNFDALSPNFIFLQFYHSSLFGGNDIPLALPEEEFYHRAVKNLDRILTQDTHKIGVIYIGKYQEHDEVAILRNQHGSARYIEFLSGLGELLRLRDCCVSEVYTGGLERNGVDGDYAYSWRTEITQVMFHIATLMPNKDKDPNCHSKKLHIGNDFVTIVYNDSGNTYNMGTIKGQFNFVEIVIRPMDSKSNSVCLNIKDELKYVFVNANPGPWVISDINLAQFVRHLAVNVNMVSVIHQSQKTPTDTYCCNWLQRLRQMKRIKSRIPKTETESLIHCAGNFHIADFTKYLF